MSDLYVQWERQNSMWKKNNISFRHLSYACSRCQFGVKARNLSLSCRNGKYICQAPEPIKSGVFRTKTATSV